MTFKGNTQIEVTRAQLVHLYQALGSLVQTASVYTDAGTYLGVEGIVCPAFRARDAGVVVGEEIHPLTQILVWSK